MSAMFDPYGSPGLAQRIRYNGRMIRESDWFPYAAAAAAAIAVAVGLWLFGMWFGG